MQRTRKGFEPSQITIEYDSYGWAWATPKIEGMEGKKQ